MSKVNVQLRVPTVGKKAGDVISVDKDAAEALVANGTGVIVRDEPKKDSPKS